MYMKLISPSFHGVLDYATVLIFLAAPSLLSFGEVPRLIAYALAGGHLLISLATAMPLGLLRLIPFPIHGWMERIIGPALIALPFLVGFSGDTMALYFFAGYGAIIIVVALITDYEAA